jgi:hypothetical protein
VQLFDLLDHIGSVQFHKAKRDDPGRILLCRFGNHFSILKRSQNQSSQVQPLRHVQEIFDEVWIFRIEMHMHVDDANFVTGSWATGSLFAVR